MAQLYPAGAPRGALRASPLMELLLIRHAEAEEPRPELPDADRALTSGGRGAFAREVAALGRMGLRCDTARHSPVRRAAETAALLRTLLDGPNTPDPLLAQAPGEELLRALRGVRMALVGHEPWLGQLAAWLITGERSHGAWFAFPKGAVAWLAGEPQPGRMELRAFMPPDLLENAAPSAPETAAARAGARLPQGSGVSSR